MRPVVRAYSEPKRARHFHSGLEMIGGRTRIRTLDPLIKSQRLRSTSRAARIGLSRQWRAQLRHARHARCALVYDDPFRLIQTQTGRGCGRPGKTRTSPTFGLGESGSDLHLTCASADGLGIRPIHSCYPICHPSSLTRNGIGH